jgi:DNA invertase Pin-like site-specific DNA recombinase
MTKAFAYLRTSSASNAGIDKDTDKRQIAAIEAYAKRHDMQIVGKYHDIGIKGSDPIMERPGFSAMIADAAKKKIKTILVESPDRFARDLVVQITGHELLKTHDIQLVPTTAPDFFLEDTPTAVMVRQILGAVAQFEKSTLVAKLKAARDRKSRKLGERIEGRRANPAAVAAASKLLRQKPDIGHRELSRKLAELKFLAPGGGPYSTSSIGYIKARALKLEG